MSSATVSAETYGSLPRTAGSPGTSREYAREWYWSVHDPDTYECPDCGRGADRVYQFDVHHRDGDPCNNAPNNLLGLCRRCHVWRHNTGPTLSGLDVDEWKRAFAGDSGPQFAISDMRFIQGDDT